MCKKRVASPGSMHDAGCLGLVQSDDPEGWYEEGGWRRVQWVSRETGRRGWVHGNIYTNICKIDSQ